MPARHFRRLACAVTAACLLLCACAQPTAAEATPEPAAATATPAPTGTPDLATARPASSKNDKSDAVSTAAAVPTVLPESADAGRSYLDGTLFIGDSNTARYMMYADDTGKAFTSVGNTIGVVSMGAGAITTLKCEKFKGDSAAYTIPDAVAKLKPQRILIGFGTNDLGSSTENFIKQYRNGLDAITAAWEYADIIVCAVPPLDYQRENTRLNMDQVNAFNTALTQMCEEEGYHFLNTAEVLTDTSSGWAKKDYTLSDGVHLSKTAVTALFGYIRTHALTTADRRPEDLGTLPTPDGVPPGLIQKDPIAVRGTKVPVEFVATNGGTIQGYTSQNVKKGGTCSTVTAVPNEGWAFSYWTASIGSVGGGASLTFTVPANADANGVIITACFTPAEHEHNYVEIEGTRVEPTCEQDGGADYKCSICGDVVEKSIPKLGHAWDSGVRIKEPTYISEGAILYTCQRDSSHTKVERIPMLAPTPTPAHTHSYVGTVTQAATCEASGVMTYTCSCGDKYTEVIPATGHNYTETVVAATCDQAGSRTLTCSTCGATTTETIPATGHNYTETVVAATCDQAGSRTLTCSTCGATTTETIPATGHSYGEPVVTNPATCGTDGSSTVTCTVCGYTETRTVPATGQHNFVTNEDGTVTCTVCGLPQ